jgi:hypothetical protein
MEFKCCQGCGKRCWVILAVVAAVILIGGAIYYFTFVYQPKESELTYADFDILCENSDLLDEAGTAEREAKLQLIYNSTGFTESELATMLPSGCSRVEKSSPEPGSCLVLEEKYCQELLGIEYQGINVLGLNLPGGTPIFAPADGAYFDNYTGEKIIEEGEEEERIPLPTRIEFWLPNSSSFLYFDSLFQEPSYEDGQMVSKGQILAYTLPTTHYLDEETQSNLIIIYSNAEMYKLLVGE